MGHRLSSAFMRGERLRWTGSLQVLGQQRPRSKNQMFQEHQLKAASVRGKSQTSSIMSSDSASVLMFGSVLGLTRRDGHEGTKRGSPAAGCTFTISPKGSRNRLTGRQADCSASESRCPPTGGGTIRGPFPGGGAKQAQGFCGPGDSTTGVERPSTLRAGMWI